MRDIGLNCFDGALLTTPFPKLQGTVHIFGELPGQLRHLLRHREPQTGIRLQRCMVYRIRQLGQRHRHHRVLRRQQRRVLYVSHFDAALRFILEDISRRSYVGGGEPPPLYQVRQFFTIVSVRLLIIVEHTILEFEAIRRIRFGPLIFLAREKEEILHTFECDTQILEPVDESFFLLDEHPLQFLAGES
ncbi:hypothetical protein IU448_20795 [Nocardia flavorosea]|uniref:hypothetical protein n=1 Tax=Nocardia flavorosea TaxID=53429 RepID=UPI001895601C|nr:hypothetical protein [Nocardia flavorosea]MBF6351430.1 hypothetical protein [Nocardia flavorosea]